MVAATFFLPFAVFRRCRRRGSAKADRTPAAKNLSPSADSCRQAILRYPVFLLCFLPPGEILKSGVGITCWVPRSRQDQLLSEISIFECVRRRLVWLLLLAVCFWCYILLNMQCGLLHIGFLKKAFFPTGPTPTSSSARRTDRDQPARAG